MSRILIVEDHPVIATMECEFLGILGHDVHVVASGEEALDAVAKEHPDVVLLDLHLRGELNGGQVFSEIRRLHGDETLVVIVSGEIRSDVTRLLADSANVAVLEKPFRLVDLEQIIQRVSA